MKKITFFNLATFLGMLVLKANNRVKAILFIAMFLFVGMSEAKADCVIPNNMIHFEISLPLIFNKLLLND